MYRKNILFLLLISSLSFQAQLVKAADVTGAQIEAEEAIADAEAAKADAAEAKRRLDEEKNKIDNLIRTQIQLLEKLKEYRSSIISHTVTGKIDVREFC